jgi:mRNA interferase RelE/StbE
VPLVGESGYRLRVGDWRVIFEVADSTMIILRVKPRGGAYK